MGSFGPIFAVFLIFLGLCFAQERVDQRGAGRLNDPNAVLGNTGQRGSLKGAPQQHFRQGDQVARLDQGAPVRHIDDSNLVNIPQAGIPRQPVVGEEKLRHRQRAKPLIAGLSTSQECGEDVQRICGHRNLQSNLEVLACVTNSDLDETDLSEECHEHIWHYKLNITKDQKFSSVAREICKPALEKFPQCAKFDDASGKLIPCLLDEKDKIQLRPCYHFLVKMGTIIYSDYRLVCNFIEDCKEDIQKHHCAFLTQANKDGDTAAHSQGAVINCLEEKIVDGETVNEDCAKQIVRLSELTSDDYHLDRNLYFACKDVRERLCEEVQSGEGKVYKCLFRHKFDHEMTPECREALTLRQKLLARDYKASYELMNYCQKDIDTLGCIHHPEYRVQDANDHGDIIGLSGMLLCLEEIAHHQDTQSHVSQQCENQLADFRQMLSEDYQMSPEIVRGCSTEINICAEKEEVLKNGQTIHCLMNLARNKDGIGGSCEAAIMHLLKEEAVLSDYRMDYALAQACTPVVQTACSHLKDGDPMILSCLMDHLHSDAMVEDCRNRLLELQYFISRDFTLDPIFMKKCKNDAKNLCGIEKFGNTENDVEMPYSLVVSCLYRHIPGAVQPRDGPVNKKKQTSRGCAEEVRKIMKTRALDFQLNPDLEKACRISLGQYCSDNVVEKGMELVCLQDAFENITLDADKGQGDAEKCIDKLEEITELEEGEAGNLDNILLRACEPDIDRLCSDKQDDDENEGEVMQCLIDNKFDLTDDCKAGVLHFQLIELKDINFSYNFMKACKSDVEKNCLTEGNKRKTKNEVVECLSEIHLRDIVEKRDDTISEECIAELSVENLQRHEDMKLNPSLKNACQADYKKFCKKGKVKGIECLRMHHHKISNQCRKQLFKFEKEEAIEPDLDFILRRTCKSAIMQFCHKEGESQSILDCLIRNKENLEDACHDIVHEREREQYSDINLNPELKDACENDIDTHCKQILDDLKKGESKGDDMTGQVTECLKEVELDQGRELTRSCSRHIRFVIKQEENDYSLDPMLTLNCLKSIQEICKPNKVPNVIECLKHAYFNGGLQKDTMCMVEVARLLKEGRMDILADPVLHNLCQMDIRRHCSDVAEGKGRIMGCLLYTIEQGQKEVLRDCADALIQRKEMWDYAVEHGAKGFPGLMKQVMTSPDSSYLLTGITAFLICILILGMVCGRVTKRVSRQRKML
ncbi:Golgi apparatus protein 1-like [Styela clava]